MKSKDIQRIGQLYTESCSEDSNVDESPKSFEGLFKPVDDIDYDPEELKKGIEVEKEHTDHDEIAETIAKHHLMEDPKYYTKLAEIHKDS